MPSVSDTIVVVVGKEYHHLGKIMIGGVVGQGVIDPEHSLVPTRIVFSQSGVDGLLEREIHD